MIIKKCYKILTNASFLKYPHLNVNLDYFCVKVSSDDGVNSQASNYFADDGDDKALVQKDTLDVAHNFVKSTSTGVAVCNCNYCRSHDYYRFRSTDLFGSSASTEHMSDQVTNDPIAEGSCKLKKERVINDL